MSEEAFEGHYRAEVRVDVCGACRGLWFDDRESIALSPAGVLALFARLGREVSGSGAAPLPGSMACPRCQGALSRTADLVRTTHFFYFRCPQGHGRFITFFQFLREKSFVQGLSTEQARVLREQIRQVSCSSCGAPVDLDKGFACSYCGAPIEVLDPEQIHRAVAGLEEQSAHRQATRGAADSAELAARLHLDRICTEARLADDGAHDLVELGLRHLFRLWADVRGSR